MDGMDVELLVVPDCPNESVAADLLGTAMLDIGLPHPAFRTTVVASQNEANRRGFTGSPTFLVDGTDLFAEPARPAGLACRLYRRPNGVGAVPELSDLRQALKRAADRH
jgi:hypothetical protein